MPGNSPFQYDLFISYSSADRNWARKLYEDLLKRDKRLRCFWDRPDLQKGLPWPEQLRDALKTSRHLVVLWSNKAFDSAWVRQEKEAFREYAGLGRQGLTLGDRRLILVLLEGEDVTESDIHQFAELREVSAYAESPAAAFSAKVQQEWDGVIGSLVTIGQAKNCILELPVLVVATNQARFATIDPDEAPPAGPTLREFAKNVGRTLDDIKADYGATAADWRPFGLKNTIATLVNQLEADLNGSLKSLSVKLVISDLLDHDTIVAQNLTKMQVGLCLVIVDPVSLYNLFIAVRFRWLHKVFENELAIVSVASPRVFDPLQYVRDQLQAIAKPIFDMYYQPPVPSALRYANCALNVCDSKDIERLLLMGLGRVVPPPAAEVQQPAFTNFSART